MTARQIRTFTAISAAAALLLGLPPAVADSSGTRACQAYSSSNEASRLPASFPDTACSWVGRVIRDTGVGLTVPPRGEEAQLDTLGLQGSRTLRLVHAKDGRISIFRDTSAGAGASSSSSPQSRPIATCSDGSFSTLGFRVRGAYSFSYNGYLAPSAVASSAAAAVTKAFANASSAATDCKGATRRPGPAARYLGAVSGRFANVSTNYTCGRSDGHNTISWLKGGTSYLAVTCLWSLDGVLRNSDAAINATASFFTGSIPSRCSRTTDLVGLMTHEAGHTYGLGHADVGSGDHAVHSNQTMNSLLAPCTVKYRTLGRGDLNGMTHLY